MAFSLPTQHAGVAALLLLSLPVVASLQFYLGYPMRWVAAQGTVGLLSLMGIDVMQQGTTLISGGQEVGVDPACSGVKMLWTGLALAGWFSARERLSLGRTGVLMAAAVGAVLIANAVRAAVLFLPESGRVDWPEWTHEGMGLVAFLGVAWGVMASSERLAAASRAATVKARCSARS